MFNIGVKIKSAAVYYDIGKKNRPLLWQTDTARKLNKMQSGNLQIICISFLPN